MDNFRRKFFEEEEEEQQSVFVFTSSITSYTLPNASQQTTSVTIVSTENGQPTDYTVKSATNCTVSGQNTGSLSIKNSPNTNTSGTLTCVVVLKQTKSNKELTITIIVPRNAVKETVIEYDSISLSGQPQFTLHPHMDQYSTWSYYLSNTIQVTRTGRKITRMYGGNDTTVTVTRTTDEKLMVRCSAINNNFRNGFTIENAVVNEQQYTLTDPNIFFTSNQTITSPGTYTIKLGQGVNQSTAMQNILYQFQITVVNEDGLIVPSA